MGLSIPSSDCNHRTPESTTDMPLSVVVLLSRGKMLLTPKGPDGSETGHSCLYFLFDLQDIS